MKLNKLLWPEIFKNTRGPEEIRKIFADVKTKVDFGPQGVQLQVDNPFMQFLHDDVNSCGSVVLALRHLHEKAPNYHVCEDFCRALWQIPDREIPLDYLPKEFLGYISFPTGLVRDTTENICGAYVYLGIADNRTTLMPNLYGERILWVGYFGEIDGGSPYTPQRLLPGIGRLVYRLDKNKTVHDLQSQFPNRDYLTTFEGLKELPVSPEEAKFRTDLTRLLINILLYLNSQDPEVMRLSPAHGRTATQARKYANEHQRGYLNMCTVPVQAINWSYKRDRSNLVSEEVFVDTFPRWQRCGPNFSQIKWIMVREHTRTYGVRKGTDET